MSPDHQTLYEALAEAAGSGRELGPEWAARLSSDRELRAIAERFGQTGKLLSELPKLPAPNSLEGRVVSTLQAGYREDRAVESLRGLTPQTAPPELEALVAASLGGARELQAPPELDARVEALLRDWEGAEEPEEETAIVQPRRGWRRVTPLALAAAASLLFVVVLAAPWESEHERARDAFVRSVEVLPAGPSAAGMSLLSGELLESVTGGLSEFASRGRGAQNAARPRVRRRAPAWNGGRAAGPSTRNGAGAQGGSQNSGTGGTSAAGRSGADLLTKLADPQLPAHHGIRLVRLSAGPDSPIVLIYREEVSVAEDGTFAIDPLEVVQPQMSPQSEDIFLLLQKARESFFYRFRDFRIRDIALFTQQYTTIQSFNSAMVGGKECVELDIQRNDGTGNRYLLWVEPNSGLCLRVQEYDAAGLFVGEVEYESVEFAPSFAAPLSGGPTTWTPIDESASPSTALLPLWIPEGYVHVSTETRSGPLGGEWLRLRYTDGVETLFVLQGENQTPETTLPRGVDPHTLTRVSVHEVGSWTVVEGDPGELHLVVLGKCHEADLVATLVSTIP